MLKKVVLIGQILIVTFNCLLLVECNKSGKQDDVIKYISGFPAEVNLNPVKIKVSPILLSPSNMCISDTFLIVSQNADDSMFSIFGLPDCKLLYRFGKKGRGPDEFIYSYPFQTLGSVNVDEGVFAVNNNVSDFQFYRIRDLLNNNISPYKTGSLPSEYYNIRSMAYIGDSVIIAAPNADSINILKYNINSNKSTVISYYPDVFPKLHRDLKREVYGCLIKAKPDNSRYIVAYAHTGRIEFYNIKDKEPYKILIYKDFPSLKDNTGLNNSSTEWNITPEQKFFCGYLAASNKYVFLGILGAKNSEIFLKDGPNRSFIPEIHVFTWEGEPVTKIKLEKFFFLLAVDKNADYFYVIDDMIANEIRRYDLKPALEK